jgi:hypothetical protein
MNFRNLLSTAVLAAFAVSLPSYAADEWVVKNMSDYKGVYKDKRRIILEAIDRLPQNTPMSERMAMYDREMNNLKKGFRAERLAEYQSKQVSITTGHSCTSRSSGGVKNCGWKCSAAPNTSLLYTTKEWVSYAGTVKGSRINKAEACIKMTVAGKGQNKGSVSAAFRYQPEVVATLLNQEVEQLVNLITDQV